MISLVSLGQNREILAVLAQTRLFEDVVINAQKADGFGDL